MYLLSKMCKIAIETHIKLIIHLNLLNGVSHWIHTKLTVAVILSLVLLPPALSHAEGIMCEVGLCRDDEQNTEIEG